MEELKKEDTVVLTIFFHGGNTHYINVKWDVSQQFFNMYRKFLKSLNAKSKEEIESLGEVWINFIFNGADGDVVGVIDFRSVASCGLNNVPKKHECASQENGMVTAFREYVNILKEELKKGDDWKTGEPE